MKKAGTPSQSTHSVTSAFSGVQLLLVQSMICIVILLTAVLLKTIGGNVYKNAVDHFQEGMYDHHLLTAPTTVQTVTSSTGSKENEVSIVSDAVAVSAENIYISAPLKNGIITSSFGRRTDPVTGDEGYMHHGVDIAAPSGTSLHALMDGTVIDVGYEESGYGWYVIVQCTAQHQYLYAHCNTILVQIDQQVSSGDIIALVGSTGKSTGDHVHFEWRENGKAVDPMNIIPRETYA